MGFWSGFEGLTGHQPGAFKGFSLKDIIDKDKWEMRERLGGKQSRQFEETGVMPTTAIYKGMGKEGMFGDVVRPYGGGQAVTPVNPAAVTPTYQNRFDATTEANKRRRANLWPPGQATVSAARPRANIQAQMLRDPVGMLQGDTVASQAEYDRLRAINRGDSTALRAAGITPAMADRTTTIKKFDDPNKSNEEITVIKDKVQGGPEYNRLPPNWMQRTGVMGEGYFGRPITSIMNMNRNIFAVDPEERRRRLAEVMRARRGY